MNDCEESFWASFLSPGKKKRKKESKKEKTCLKQTTTGKAKKNTDKKKKKKTSKFKEEMETKKEKKKGKKKKKIRLTFTGDGHFNGSLQGTNAQPNPPVEPETIDPLNNDEFKAVQDYRKKKKRKKKVAFDVSPSYICAMRPQCPSSPQQSPKEPALLENESVGCSQVTVTGQSQSQAHNDSQCTTDDINSQDLFITQKTFQPPSLPSSDEASEETIKTTPLVAQIKEHHKELIKSPHFHQTNRATEHVLKQRSVKEEDRGVIKKEPLPFHGINPYLDEPIEVSSSPESKNLQSGQKSPSVSVLPSMCTTSTATQTENFFTTELSSYIHFHRRMRKSLLIENLEPLDLSLAERSRKGLRTCLSEKTSSFPRKVKGVHRKKQPFCSADSEDVEVKTELTDAEAVESLPSESENKSADTMTSSEDNEQLRCTGKLDLAQVRAVQMRLNESFYFKTKGEAQSPRPESPLMKLALSSKEVKRRKKR